VDRLWLTSSQALPQFTMVMRKILDVAQDLGNQPLWVMRNKDMLNTIQALFRLSSAWAWLTTRIPRNGRRFVFLVTYVWLFPPGLILERFRWSRVMARATSFSDTFFLFSIEQNNGFGRRVSCHD